VNSCSQVGVDAAGCLRLWIGRHTQPKGDDLYSGGGQLMVETVLEQMLTVNVWRVVVSWYKKTSVSDCSGMKPKGLDGTAAVPRLTALGAGTKHEEVFAVAAWASDTDMGEQKKKMVVAAVVVDVGAAAAAAADPWIDPPSWTKRLHTMKRSEAAALLHFVRWLCLYLADEGQNAVSIPDLAAWKEWALQRVVLPSD
jgi:hypothetical protein